MRTFSAWKSAVMFLVLFTAVQNLAYADGDDKKLPDDSAKSAKPTKAGENGSGGLTERELWLLDRVEQLEKRVAELESKQPSAAAESSSGNPGSPVVGSKASNIDAPVPAIAAAAPIRPATPPGTRAG